jgi:hypothetical protein
MTEFLQSIKSDLLSRRLLPLLALLGVALIAAVGYAVTGGSSSSTPVRSAGAPSAPGGGAAAAIAVAVAPANPNEAVSETPAGARYQSQGPTRDPFVPLPSAPAAKTAGSSSSSSSSGKSTGSSSTGSSSSGAGSSNGGSSAGGQKAPAPAPKKKSSKPQFPYLVTVLFGLAPGTPGQAATLIPYENLKLLQPLPTKQDERISFERVTADGNGAVFKLVVPPILHGAGVCLPSTSECQTIDLESGHSEELEYVETDGQTIVYELKVISITKKSASAARVRRNAHAARAKRKASVARAGHKVSVARTRRGANAARNGHKAGAARARRR